MRRWRPTPWLAALAAVSILAACEADDGASPAPSSSPALVVVEGVDGLPPTVAALPATDAAAFRAILDGLHGTPVVVNLWASWCEPCTREMPMLATAAREHPDVQFLGVDSLDSRDGAERFIAEHAVPFPSVFDPDGAIRTDLAGIGLPITFFFDADGAQVGRVDGELSPDALEEHLAAIAR